jgi:hypothetical protein
LIQIVSNLPAHGHGLAKKKIRLCMPKSSFDLEIIIDRNIEDVFGLLHDYSQRLSWDKFLKRAEILRGPIGTGCEVLCQEKKIGLKMQVEYTSYKPPVLAAIRMTKGPKFLKSFTGTWLLSKKSSSKTLVKFHYNIIGNPAWMGPVLRFIFTQESRARLRNLKTFMELKAFSTALPGRT